MKTFVKLSTMIAVGISLAACTNSLSPIEYAPIPGSITYKGQPKSKLNRVPIGSTFQHEIQVGSGDYYIETYQVQPDRNLKIIRRYLRKERLFNDL